MNSDDTSPFDSPKSFDHLAQRLGLELRGETWAGPVRGQQVVLTWRQDPTKKRAKREESIHIGFARELDLGLDVRRLPANPIIRSFQDLTFDDCGRMEADEPDRLALLARGGVHSGWQLLDTLIPRSLQWGINDSSFYLSEGASGMPQVMLDQTIDSAIDNIVLLLDQCASIPVPQPLARHEDIWGAFARAQGLTLERGPLRMHGRLEHLQVGARVMRTDVLEYRSELTVAFPASLRLGLMIEPQSSIETPGEWNDRTLGDDAFDAAFRLGAHNPQTARNLFDRDTRRLLMEIASQVANFELTDDRLALWPSFALEPAGTVPQLMLQATDLASRILRGAEGRPAGNTYR